jgi:predicted Zn finger-like uncharacterized protein
MALVTRCSNTDCLTMFRVTPAQLQASGGQVRCGSCGTVFDAFPSLTTVADAALKAPVPAPAQALAREPAQEPARVPDVPAGTDAASTPRDAFSGERVAEWTPDAALPQVDAQSPNQPMMVDRVADLPDEGPLPAAAAAPAKPASVERPRDTVRVSPPPPPPPLDVDLTDAAPPFAPELTDYSVTAEAPSGAKPAASRMHVVGVTAVLLLAVAAAVLLLAGDRLPAPLAGLVAGVSPAALALLREYPIALAAALLGLLCVVLRRYRTTWIVVSCLLALLLAGQALHAYRTQIAAHYPASRPVLEHLCRIARCEVGLPKAADQLVIESSDLQAVDTAKPNLIQLAASVRNGAAIDVAFPAIEVTLTDAQDRPLARRVLLPDQYLAGGNPERRGLRAGEAFSIRLTLDTTELRPVGYRLYLFYP